MEVGPQNLHLSVGIQVIFILVGSGFFPRGWVIKVILKREAESSITAEGAVSGRGDVLRQSEYSQTLTQAVPKHRALSLLNGYLWSRTYHCVIYIPASTPIPPPVPYMYQFWISCIVLYVNLGLRSPLYFAYTQHPLALMCRFMQCSFSSILGNAYKLPGEGGSLHWLSLLLFFNTELS